MTDLADNHQQIQVYPLGYTPDIPKEYLGKLITSVQERFVSFSLLPIFYTDKSMRERYRLYVTRSLQTTGDPWPMEQCFKGDLENIRVFVMGFAYGVQSD